MQARNRLQPDAFEAVEADFSGRRAIEGRFPAHVVAVKTAHDIDLVADAERVGQLVQGPAGDAARDLVAEVPQQALEARIVALDVGGPVHRHLDTAASGQEVAQRSVHLARA